MNTIVYIILKFTKETYPLVQPDEPYKPLSVQFCRDQIHLRESHWVFSYTDLLASPHQFADTLAESRAKEKELGCESNLKKKTKTCQCVCRYTCNISVCLTEEVVLKLPFGRMSSVAAATSAMSLPGFPSETEEEDLSEAQYWSTFSRESITTASGKLLSGSTSGKLQKNKIKLY